MSKKIFIKKSVSWKKKGRRIAVYYRYNYYFFKKDTARWFEEIAKNKGESVPEEFKRYLADRGLVIRKI